MSRKFLILVSISVVVMTILCSCKSSQGSHCDAYTSLQLQETDKG